MPSAKTVPDISIICGSYNYGRFIGATIRSVLAQTHSGWELIIIDDASTDDSVEVIQAFQDPRIRLIVNGKQQGLPANWEIAFRESKGRYVMNLDSDDQLSSDQIFKQIKFLDANPKMAVLGTFLREVDAQGATVIRSSTESWYNFPLDFSNLRNWTLQNRIAHSGAVVRRSAREQVNGFDTDLKYTCDYDLWLKILVTEWELGVMPEQLLLYRVHGTNLTRKDPTRMILEIIFIYHRTLLPYIKTKGDRGLLDEWVGAILENNDFCSLDVSLQVKLISMLVAPTRSAQTFTWPEFWNWATTTREESDVVSTTILKFHSERSKRSIQYWLESQELRTKLDAEINELKNQVKALESRSLKRILYKKLKNL